MCLLTKQTGWRWATNDIECYKVVNRYRNFGGDAQRYYTPYMDTIIPENVINGKRYFRAKGRAKFVLSDRNDVRVYEVNDGAIHVFDDENGGWSSFNAGVGNSLYKCVIPKGTRYAVGLNGDICAKKIKFLYKMN